MSCHFTQKHCVELSQAVERSSPREEEVHTTPVAQETVEASPEGSPVIDPIAQMSAPCQMRSGRIIRETAPNHKSSGFGSMGNIVGSR